MLTFLFTARETIFYNVLNVLLVMGIIFEKGRSVVSESYWDPGSEHRFNHGDLEVNWVVFVNTTFQKW